MDPTDAELARRIACADRLFRSAARENHDWQEFIDRREFRVGVKPPWWDTGVECVWVFIAPRTGKRRQGKRSAAGLTSLNYQETWTPEFASDFVFRLWLAEYEEDFAAGLGNEPVVEQWVERARPAFVRYAVRALGNRIDDLLLDPPVEPAEVREPTVENQPGRAEVETQEPTKKPTENTAIETAPAPTAENPVPWWVRFRQTRKEKYPIRRDFLKRLQQVEAERDIHLRVSIETIRKQEIGKYVPEKPSREVYAEILTGQPDEDLFGRDPQPDPRWKQKPPAESVPGDTVP
jgi:hypothetical protein